MTRRLFIGIRIPTNLQGRLVGLQSGVPGAKWVAPENFHITLSFLGDMDESRFEDLHNCLKDISAPSFDVTLAGTGAFGSKAPNLLWAGLEPCAALVALQSKLAGRLVRASLLTETRKYSPHVTLAYLRGGRTAKDLKLGPWFEQTAPFLSVPFKATNFTLIESRLSDSGSSYIDLEDYPLGGGPA